MHFSQTHIFTSISNLKQITSSFQPYDIGSTKIKKRLYTSKKFEPNGFGVFNDFGIRERAKYLMCDIFTLDCLIAEASTENNGELNNGDGRRINSFALEN